MKTTLVIFSFFLLSFTLKAQVSADASAIRSLIQSRHPELSVKDKILAVNIWSEKDQKSRSCNKAFEKSYLTYWTSKLQGGSKGLIVILFNTENLTEFAVITLGKDGISKSLSYPVSDLDVKPGSFKNNAVFDSKDHLLYKELEPETIFETFHSLITR